MESFRRVARRVGLYLAFELGFLGLIGLKDLGSGAVRVSEGFPHIEGGASVFGVILSILQSG